MRENLLGRLSAWIVLLLALMNVTGCDRAVNRTAERKIRDALPDILGPARLYRVHVDNAAERTVQGRLAHVIIDGDDVRMSNGMMIDKLHLDLKGVDVDTANRRLRDIRSAQFTAVIGQASLDEFLAGESPEDEPLRNIRITLGTGNKVTLAAERITLGLGVPFQATGPLKLLDSQHILLDPDRLIVIGIPISGRPLRFLKQRFESALDLSTLPIPIHVTQVGTMPGQLAISGTAEVTPMLLLAQEHSR